MNKRKKSATVHDVAREANVSPSTVSRVFDPKWDGKVKRDTVERVLSAANQLAYSPNAIARSLHINRTNIVAVIMGVQVGYFFEEFFFELVSVLQASGRQVLVFTFSPEKDIDEVMERVRQYRVDVVLVLASATQNTIHRLVSTSIPVILIERLAPDSNLSCICSDNYAGARMAAEYLMSMGHRRFGYLSGDASLSSAILRSAGFVDCVQVLGGTVAVRVDGDFSYQSAWAALDAFLADGRIDAIFCADDTMAMGIMDAARQRGVAVPDELSVMGFDNHSITALASYQITTVSHNRPMLFSAVLDTLNIVIASPDRQICKILPMSVVERSSVKRLT